MGIQLIFKIGAVGIIVALINQVLKHSGRDDQAYLVSLTGLIIVLSWIIPYVYDLFQDISRLFDLGGM
ncbi:MAG: stage III sporulation protein AC [Lachnospiraceae bacterium]|nr:stage III sporulation protein AC [Lachnospiraceae bacterium]